MDRMLSKGMTGQDVRSLQDVLNYQIRRGDPLVVDGIFGPKTDARLREFQRSNSLVADGIAGPKTNALLFEVTIIPLPIVFLPSLSLTLPKVGQSSQAGLQPPRLIPQLQWPGPPFPAPPPFQLGGSFQLKQNSQTTLPNFFAPANALGLKVKVPTRQDPLDPTVRSFRAITELINDLPVNSKFKAFLLDQVPNPVTKIEPPSTGFKWGLAPLFDPLDPKGFGVKGNARFTIRVTEGAGGLPNMVFGAWGDGRFFLDFESKKGESKPRVKADGQFFLGVQGVF